MNSSAQSMCWIKSLLLTAALCLPSAAVELRIQLNGRAPISRNIVRFRCDQRAPRLGLPPGSFEVEYWNGAGNSLAVLPIRGQSLIFANVSSGSGARYASGNLIWWDAGRRSVSLSNEFDASQRTECRKTD